MASVRGTVSGLYTVGGKRGVGGGGATEMRVRRRRGTGRRTRQRGLRSPQLDVPRVLVDGGETEAPRQTDVALVVGVCAGPANSSKQQHGVRQGPQQRTAGLGYCEHRFNQASMLTTSKRQFSVVCTIRVRT